MVQWAGSKMNDFGKLKRLELSSVWRHEASEFTPWLAENIQRLGEALGMELEMEQREASMGDFSVDILARDLGTDRLVVIENQFGSTNHDHLGKLLTYAAGFDAGAVIWICENIREEHRQALDWLNQRTDSSTHFFGIIVELLQIDESRPAYNFRPVVLPNEWQKQQKRRGERTLSSKGEAYRKYFQKLIDELRNEHNFTGARIGQPQNWYSFATGLSGVSYTASFTQGGRVRAEVYIGTSDEDFNKKLFDYLYEEKDQIENEFEEPLEWERLDSRIASRVAIYRYGSIDDQDLDGIRHWHIEKLLKLKKVFGPRITRFRKKTAIR
jgi:hypothetical protein